MRYQLENCPFCGSIHIGSAGYLLSYRIECRECGACGPKRKTHALAKESWNHQSRELRFEKELESRQLLEHLNSFGSLPPPSAGVHETTSHS